MIPDIKITRRTLFKDAPAHYRANAMFPDGRDLCGTGDTPAEALASLAAHWVRLDHAGMNGDLLRHIMRGKRR